MSIYQQVHPWDPGYDIPKYVRAEPQGRGTFTTKQLPRGTFGPVPKDRQVWNRTTWAGPDYTQGRYGKTAQTTKMLPRRTVTALAPDPFGRPKGLAAMGSTLDGSTLKGSTLKGNTLGALAAKKAAPPRDAIVDYGKRGAAWVVKEAMKFPPARRKVQLEALFDKLGIKDEVEKKAVVYRTKYPAKEALTRAIAASLANKLAEDLVKLGKNEAPSSAVGLGAYSAVGFSLNPVSWVESGVKKLGSLTCGVLKSPAGTIGGAAAGGVFGGPLGAQAGATGVQVAAGVCPKGTVPIAPVPPGGPSSWASGPIIPIAAALGGALVLIVALK